ncbi:basic region leucin zipper protein [Mycena crocata]|nr:basic region leucin zipper protein [Mycena crocata]
MTRGRKKDHTIPPTRALTLQRDYRARKSQYVADLEARCKAAEEENVRLRKELETARQRIPQPALSPEALQASAQLKETLAAASASLAQFIHVALPSEATPPAYAALLQSPSSPHYSTNEIPNATVAADFHHRPESPCCGGYINCEGLVEEEDEEYGHEAGGSTSMTAISQLRSTSGASKAFE